MPLISVPIKTRNNYLQMCRDCFFAVSPEVYRDHEYMAKGYFKALQDVLPLEVVGQIRIEADMQFDLPDNVPMWSGLPESYSAAKELISEYPEAFK